MLAVVGLHLVRDVAASPAQLEAGAALMRVALGLSPEDMDLWRSASLVAAMQDPTSPRTSAWQSEITQQLSRLDPNSPVFRLARLGEWVSLAPTAEQQVARLESLTSPERIHDLSAPVAAALCWDLSRLQLQRGDFEGSDRALSRALEVDAFFPPARVAAAGLAMERHHDPVRRAEWLIAAIEANPRSFEAIQALAALLLHEGAYAPAARILAMVVAVSERDLFGGRSGIEHAVADEAIALAGAGDLAAARRVLTEFEARRAALFRDQLLREGSTSRLEADAFNPPPIELLSVVDAWLAVAAGASDAEVVAGSAVQVLATAAATRMRDEAMPEGIKRLAALESAYAMAGLGAAAQEVDRVVAPWAGSLGPEAKATIAGLLSLREGRYQAALDALAGAGDDPAVQLARGSALLGLGRRSEAGRCWQAAMESGRGTLIGVLARQHLQSLLGAPIQPPEVATRLAVAVDDLPIAVDRLLTSGEPAVEVTVTAQGAVIPPFELPRITVSLTNRTSLELSVCDIGPITPFLALTWELTPLNSSEVIRSSAPVLVPIEQDLLLGQRETIDIQVNPLALTELLFISNAYMGTGVTFRVVAVVNPESVPSRAGERSGIAASPGELGTRRESSITTWGKFVDSAAWLEEVQAALRHPDAPSDLRTFATVAARVATLAPGIDSGRTPTPAERSEAEFLASTLANAWPQLPPLARAYLILVSPRTESAPLEAIYASAKQDAEPLVRACYVLRRVGDSQDPFLAECESSADPLLALMARAQRQILVRRAVQAGSTGAGDG